MNSGGFAKIERRVIDRIVEVGPTAFAVYAVLAAHADPLGTCWPSVATIAAIVGASGRTVKRGLRRLERAGLLTRRLRRRAPPVYILPQGVTCMSAQESKGDMGVHQGVTRVSTKGDTRVTQNKNQEQEPENRGTPAASHPPSLDRVVEIWNRIEGVSPCRKLTDSRRRAFRVRAKDPDWTAQLDEALRRVAESDFLTGLNARGWRADLSWFLRPDSVTKLLEGAYDNHDGRPGRPRIPKSNPHVFRATDR